MRHLPARAVDELQKFFEATNALEEKKLKPSLEADRATLIERASLDLTGLRPTYAEVQVFVSDKDPKDLDSLVMVGRLNRVLENSVDAEAAFKKVLAADPENEDAVTGLASVYTDRGDAKGEDETAEAHERPCEKLFQRSGCVAAESIERYVRGMYHIS